MVKSWLVTVFTSGILALLGLSTSAVLARALGVEGRGILASAMLLAMLAAGIGQFGLGPAIVFQARSSGGVTLRSRAVTTTLIIATSGAGIAWALVLVAPGLVSSVRDWTVAFGAATAALTFITAAAQIDLRLVAFNYLRIAAPGLSFLGLLLFWRAAGLTVSTAIGIQCVIALACVAIGLPWLRGRLSRCASPTACRADTSWIAYLRLGAGYQGTALLGLALNNIDNIYLLAVNNPWQFGIYASAYSMSRLMAAAQNAVGTAIFAQFAGTHISSGIATVATLRAFRITFIPMLGVALAVTLVAQPLVATLLGDSFSSASVPFSILLFEAVIGGASWLLAQQFNAQGRPGKVFVRQLISIVPVALLIWFVPSNAPATGLAILMLISAMTRLAVTLVIYQRVFNVKRVRMAPARDDVAWIWKQLGVRDERDEV